MRMSTVPLSTSVSTGPTVLRCLGLSKAYTGAPQFEDISITLSKGQRVGLIGVNGAGKSTLLRCLAGIDKADKGNVEVSTNSNIIYVDQDPNWENMTALSALFSGDTAEAKATRFYYSVMANMEDDVDGTNFSRATDAMQEASAWDYETRALTIAERLNIGGDKLYRDVSTLSGGECRRLGLASALAKQPDVLLLDEPTNHLDIDALEWLADYLRPGRDKDMTVLLVTHDRYFLERACTEIIELDRASVYRYPGNYTRYLELREARLQAEDADVERARIKLRRESEWMSRQPQARQAKSKARQNQFYELVDKVKGGAPNVRALEMVTQEEKDHQQRLGGVVAEFHGASYKMADKHLLSDFTYSFRQRDRIGVVGPNGVGKSTFLKVLLGMLKLQTGNVRVGETVKFGYYEQAGLQLTPEQEKQPVLQFVQEAVEKAAPAERPKTATLGLRMEEPAEQGRRKRLAGKEATANVQFEEMVSGTMAVSERDAMSLLTRFQFPSKRWYDRVGQLSGGERRRLQLLQILARKPNVLILDEPSNDLDLSTLSSLEDYLTEVFEGCLVVVSHDRFFMDRVTEHLFVFEGDGIVRNFLGSYSDYLDFRKSQQWEVTEAARQVKDETKKTVKTEASKGSSGLKAEIKPTIKSTSDSKKISEKNSSLQSIESRKSPTFTDRKELSKIEKEMEKLQVQLKEVQKKLASSTGNEGYTLLAEWSEEESRISTLLNLKEIKWLELTELCER